MHSIRVAVVLLSGVLLAASASAPTTHKVSRVDTIRADFESAWEGAVALFADRGWAIKHSEKGAGLLRTEMMKGAEAYADCGSSGVASVTGTVGQVDVFVKKAEGGWSDVTVNTVFKQERFWDNRTFVVDCNSLGSLEREIQAGVAKFAKRGLKEKKTVDAQKAAASRFYCTSAPADETLAACTRSEMACAKKQSAIIDAAGDATKCEPSASAFCFMARNGAGINLESCGPNQAACEKLHAAIAADATNTEQTPCSSISR